MKVCPCFVWIQHLCESSVSSLELFWILSCFRQCRYLTRMIEVSQFQNQPELQKSCSLMFAFTEDYTEPPNTLLPKKNTVIPERRLDPHSLAVSSVFVLLGRQEMTRQSILRLACKLLLSSHTTTGESGSRGEREDRPQLTACVTRLQPLNTHALLHDLTYHIKNEHYKCSLPSPFFFWLKERELPSSLLWKMC